MKGRRGVWLGLVCLALCPTQAFSQGTSWDQSITAGRLAFEQGRPAEAEQHLVTALKDAEAFGTDDPRLPESLQTLAALYYAQGRDAEAEPLYQRALVILMEKRLGPDHPDLARGLNNLAGVYRTQSRYAEAEPLYKRSLAI